MEICPKYKKCPIFIGESTTNENTEEIFRNLYCKAGKDKYIMCLRYLVAEKTGVAPPKNILPNSNFSIDEIILLMEEIGLMKK